MGTNESKYESCLFVIKVFSFLFIHDVFSVTYRRLHKCTVESKSVLHLLHLVNEGEGNLKIRRNSHECFKKAVMWIRIDCIRIQNNSPSRSGSGSRSIKLTEPKPLEISSHQEK